MISLLQIDWASLFVPETPLLEIIVRGTIVYVGLFFLLRLVLKRQAGAVSITDLLVIVLIADAAQNAMAADYRSISDGLLLVSTILFWSYFLDWLGYHFRPVQRLINPPPLPLVKQGQVLYRNMRKELITEGELMSKVREQGVETLKEVRAAYMEGDGSISVITYSSETQGTFKQRLR